MANRIIQASQQTICWHVDDVKSSHKSKEVQDEFEDWLINKYDCDKKGKIVGKLKRCLGKRLAYLGMILDYTVPGEVKIDMSEYTKKMITQFEEMMGEIGTAKTPAAEHLFMVNEDGVKLDEEKSVIFHNMTAKALYLSKRARPDIQVAVSFLTTRVQKPDEDDWKKLLRMLKYLKATMDLELTLRDDGNGPYWWIDSSHGVHPDMKGHTGATVSMGKGSVFSKSTKQKINATSSTEAELVGTYECMLEVLWTSYFLEAQGYAQKKAMIYQDNKSAILLEKNGKMSSSKRTKHINIRYYFIQDRWSKGEVDIKYCPTDEMIADFFTKPLQGRKFVEFRKFVLGLEE